MSTSDNTTYTGYTTLEAAQLKLVPDLPLSNSSSFDIVAVLGNKDTVRVNWDTLVAGNTRQIDAAAISGEGLSSGAPYITFAADETGLYVSNGTAWRKMATYGANWDDLATDGTRFLPVNATVTLSEEEIANVKRSINLDYATAETAGLVKVSTDPSALINIDVNGTLTVREATPITTSDGGEGSPGAVYIKDYYDGYDENDSDINSSRCAVTEKYVHEALSSHTYSVPFANKDQAGIVIVAHDSPLTISDKGGILDIDRATDESYGAVKLVSDGEELPSAASVGYVNKYADNAAAKVQNTLATSSTPGTVKIADDSAINITNGYIDVKQANSEQKGAVFVAKTLSDTEVENPHTVPTAYAVVKFVNDKLEDVSQSVQPATTTTAGTVKPGRGLALSSDGSGTLNLLNAGAGEIGGVLVEDNGTNDTAKYTVYSKAKVDSLLTETISDISVSAATYDRLGTVKLGTATVLQSGSGFPVGKDDTGRLRVAFSTSDIFTDALASNKSPGVVMLSGDTVSNSVNSAKYFAIIRKSDGTIYANPESRQATSSYYGSVKLSTSSISSAEGLLKIGLYDGKIYAVPSSSSSTSGTSSGISYCADKIEEPKSGAEALGYVAYYKASNSDGSYSCNVLCVPQATYNDGGTVRLGVEDVIKNASVYVGADAVGRLCIDPSDLSGVGSGSGSVSVRPATDTTDGVVKLGVARDNPITEGLPVGVNADGQLYVASTSTDLAYADTDTVGGVILSSVDAAENYSVICKNTGGQIVVPAAEAGGDYGAVRIGGPAYTSRDSYTLIGLSPEGELAVSGISGPGTSVGGSGSAPLSVTLLNIDGSKYRVTMTGGSLQMADGTIVNVNPITEAQNLTITPSEGQTLQLKVYITEYGDAVAQLQLVSGVNTLSCTPSLY